MSPAARHASRPHATVHRAISHHQRSRACSPRRTVISRRSPTARPPLLPDAFAGGPPSAGARPVYDRILDGQPPCRSVAVTPTGVGWPAMLGVLRHPAARRAALVVWCADVVLIGFAVIVQLVGSRAGLAAPMSSNVVFVAFAASYASVGALISTRRQENPIGWIFLASGTSFAISAAAFAYADYGLAAGHSLPGVVAAGVDRQLHLADRARPDRPRPGALPGRHAAGAALAAGAARPARRRHRPGRRPRAHARLAGRQRRRPQPARDLRREHAADRRPGGGLGAPGAEPGRRGRGDHRAPPPVGRCDPPAAEVGRLRHVAAGRDLAALDVHVRAAAPRRADPLRSSWPSPRSHWSPSRSRRGSRSSATTCSRST